MEMREVLRLHPEYPGSHVVDAVKDAHVVCGLKHKADKETLRVAAAGGGLEKYLQRIQRQRSVVYNGDILLKADITCRRSGSDFRNIAIFDQFSQNTFHSNFAYIRTDFHDLFFCNFLHFLVLMCISFISVTMYQIMGKNDFILACVQRAGVKLKSSDHAG